MSNVAIIETQPSALEACTISRHIENYEMVIDAMEKTFGESWGDVPFDDAPTFLMRKDSEALRFLILAMNMADEGDLDQICAIVAQGKARGLAVIALSDAISPAAMHKFMRAGVDDFLPYPLPDDALDESIARLKDDFAAKLAAKEAAEMAAEMAMAAPATLHSAEIISPNFKPKGDRDGVILPLHGLAGGVGTSALAVNLAHEMALLGAESKSRVCLIDFNFQFGNAATYLDLPRRDAVMDFLSEAALSDSETMLEAMQTTKDGLYVLTSPAEMMPLEIITPADVAHILDMAHANFDYVIIDMPTTIVSWTETVLTKADVYFAVVGLDLRSAQNVLRLLRALKTESLPYEKLRFALNRAPGFTDLAAKARVKRMADSLDISMELQLPDGGVQVAQSCDQGMTLAQTAPKNPLRREIQKLAKSLIEVNTAQNAPVKAKR